VIPATAFDTRTAMSTLIATLRNANGSHEIDAPPISTLE